MQHSLTRTQLLSDKLLPKTRQIYQRLYELYMTENNGTGKGQEVCWASLFQDQHSLFELADRLPFLLQIANQEGAWTLTNLSTYHEKVGTAPSIFRSTCNIH